jgi:REP element-mobilizing transposase RayT
LEKFQDKYRIPSARVQWWDYGSNAAYFITICTQNKIHYFGNIIDQKMEFSEIGKYAETCWYEIQNHFPFVKLGAFVVMPNHIHGIIIIDKSISDAVETQDFASSSKNIISNVETNDFASPSNDNISPDETQDFASLQSNKFGPQSRNLASIIRGYKIGVTKSSRIIQPDFKWQPRFHDHIIRNFSEFMSITKYIESNPWNWENDPFK